MIVALTFLPLIGTKDPVSILSFRKPRVTEAFFFKELLVGKGGRLRKNTDMLKRTPYLVHYVVTIDYNNNNTNNNNNN